MHFGDGFATLAPGWVATKSLTTASIGKRLFIPSKVLFNSYMRMGLSLPGLISSDVLPPLYEGVKSEKPQLFPIAAFSCLTLQGVGLRVYSR